MNVGAGLLRRSALRVYVRMLQRLGCMLKINEVLLGNHLLVPSVDPPHLPSFLMDDFIRFSLAKMTYRFG